MKKILSFVLVLALCLSMGATVLAADNLVPSIGDKNAPDVVADGDMVAELVKDHNRIENGEVTSEELLITPVSKVDSAEKLPEENKELLKKVYAGLRDGSIKIPYDKVVPGVDPAEMVIRDLFDVTLIGNEEHKAQLAQPDIFLRLTLDLGVKAGTEVTVMVYKDGKWESAQNIVNNGDGTVTMELPDEGPVVICVRDESTPPQTGDANRHAVAIYGSILVICLIAMIVLIVLYRKKNAKK